MKRYPCNMMFVKKERNFKFGLAPIRYGRRFLNPFLTKDSDQLIKHRTLSRLWRKIA